MRLTHLIAVVAILALALGLVVAAQAAQRLVAGQLGGGGGASSGGGLKLVGSIPASPAGVSTGGGLRLTGGFTAAARTWTDSAAEADAVANTPSGMVTSLAAVGTARGAQITFTLSAPATVQLRILNVAGRLVHTVAASQPCTSGLNTLVWTGTSDAGLSVPNGLYLVEVTAHGESGSQSRAVATVQLGR